MQELQELVDEDSMKSLGKTRKVDPAVYLRVLETAWIQKFTGGAMGLSSNKTRHPDNNTRNAAECVRQTPERACGRFRSWLERIVVTEGGHIE